MLTRIYLDNFRCFSNFEWHPGKLVLLAGRNGSGKSSILEVVTGIARVLHESETLAAVFPPGSTTRWERRTEQRVELDVRLPEGEFRYLLRLDHGWKKGKVRVLEERLSVGEQVLFHFQDGEVHLYQDDGKAGPVFSANWGDSVMKTVPERPTNTKLTAFRDALRRYWLIHPMPESMADTSRAEADFLTVDLANFVDWYRLASGDAMRVGQLMGHLKEVFKDFAGLRLEPTGRDERLLQAVFQLAPENGRRAEQISFDLHELSEGQRLLIALYALNEFGPVRDGLLCLDEPTNYLAMEEIEPWLKELEAALDEGDGQVFIASHNGEVVNRLWATHGVWFERDGLGPVRIRPTEPADGLTPAELMARGWA